jgi:hypothetical protein
MAAKMVQVPFRAPENEIDSIRERAHARGMSMNAYMRRQLDIDQDATAQALKAAIARSYAHLAGSAEFDALDRSLAAVPRPAPAELGFDPATAVDADTGTAV